ncbi:MAG: RNA polymerase-binding protein DksA [Rudaea sp.]
MANSKRKPVGKKSAAKQPVAKKSAVTRVAKKPAAHKPAPKTAARAKPVAKGLAHKPAKSAHKPVPKKPVKAASKPAPRRSGSKPVRAQTPHKAAVSPKKGRMSTGTEKDTVTREDGRYALPSTTVIHLAANYHPGVREEYMGPRHLAYFRAKLQKWREDLVEESKQTIDNLRDEVRDVGDEAERATRETENSLELRTRDRYRKLIAKIDKALKRIEEGRYGYCEETEEEIGLERLEARPIATLCLDAQERWEHRQKQMGD